VPGASVTPSYQIRALSAVTWPDFANLVERHGGVWGGCWCLAFHAEGGAPGAHRREAKEKRVLEGRAHAALVYDGELCVGWCQYGSRAELPRIKHGRAYGQPEEAPDWRVTCFFVDKAYRRRGVADAAFAGALLLMREAGGGRVESYPEEVEGRTVSSSFLHNASLSLFERHGFARTRRLGKNHWVATREL